MKREGGQGALFKRAFVQGGGKRAARGAVILPILDLGDGAFGPNGKVCFNKSAKIFIAAFNLYRDVITLLHCAAA